MPLRKSCLGQRLQVLNALEKLRIIESDAHGETLRATSPAHSSSLRKEQRMRLVSQLIVRIHLFEFALFLFKYAEDPIPRGLREECMPKTDITTVLARQGSGYPPPDGRFVHQDGSRSSPRLERRICGIC
jgi:hypothetical protein